MKYKIDKFGRGWKLPKKELCPECGQPDNCGDCNHEKLRKRDVIFLEGKLAKKEMSLMTIEAISRHSSDTMSRTFVTDSAKKLKKAIKEWEKEIPYRRYELICNELIDEYPHEIVDVLDELEVTY